ncbi:porin family protein [Aestuariibius sp. 2305UL40-4]|uniref:porin family protein n=1 Tax=Aestuariibius violaceus TaxID=3234132 RepID=UPI00345EDEF3
MTRFAILTTVLVSVPALVSAQDIPTGPYIGATIGYTEYDDTDVDFEGTEYGLVAGVGATRGRLYGAVELDFALSDVDADFDSDVAGDPSFEEESKFGISFIIGTAISPDFLLYGKLSAISIEYEAEFFGESDSESYNGTSLGIGTEYFFAPNTSVRGEVNAFEIEFDDDGLDAEAEGSTVKVGIFRRF